MTTLAYRPLFVAIFALQTLTAAAVLLSRLPPGRIVLPLLVYAALCAVAVARGYALSRRSYVAGNAAQLAQIVLVVFTMFVWMSLLGPTGLFVASGLVLLLARNVTMTVRRALYFDLGILATLFYDAIGTEGLPWRWPLAVAFLLILLFVLMSDYTDRRLAYLKLGDARELNAMLPAARNAAFATALVMAVAAVVYIALPQPAALDVALFPDRGPPSSWLGSLVSESKPTPASDDAQGGGFRIASDKGGASGGGKGNRGGAGGGGKANGQGASGGSGSAKGSAEGRSGDGEDEGPAGGGEPQPIALFLMRADRPLYLRTHAYALPEGGEWREGPHRWIDSRGSVVRKAAPREGVRQRVLVTRDMGTRIPLAYLPDGVRFDAPRFRIDGDHVIGVDKPLRADMKYDAFSTVHYLGPRPSGAAEEKPPAGYLLLPQRLPPRVTALAREIVTGRSVASEKADALERYLRERYAAKPFDADGKRDTTEQFLFENRGGASRDFAGALAIMLRSVGIPSRVVSGYRARRLNPLHKNYEIWDSDAHHWVEAYVGVGWVTYEPSPWAELPERSAPDTAFAAAREYVRLAREPATDMRLAGKATPAVSEAYLYRVLVWSWFETYGTLLLLGIVALGAAAWRWRWWTLPLRDALDRWRLRAAGAGDAAAVRLGYAIVERMCARRSLARGRGENHAEHLARLGAARPHLASPCAALADFFSAARYGTRIDAAHAAAALLAARAIAELIDEKP